MSCLSEDAVLEFVEGRATPALAAEIDVHLASCEVCRRVIADVAEGVSHPMQLGRYEVVRTLGVGGMGVVYEAHDPHLHRRVALKVMRADHVSDDAQARALREARAMAQVSHPNVVAVHDVGVVDGQIFIAMEFVDGQTLRALMKTRPPWRLVFQNMLQAGDGLAAAHEAGLVHRDFKPDNVLLGKDGRVRVTDFGLARLASARDEETPGSRRKNDDVLTTLTRTNLFVGTPAYMAPEQFAGKNADPRSDQFAFCVVLYEAIYGRRPFKGANLKDLTASALTADLATSTPKTDEPPLLRAALLKGLARDPAKRHESVRELLVALRDADRPRSRRWMVPLGGAAALAVAIAAFAFGTGSKSPSSAPKATADLATPASAVSAAAVDTGTTPSAAAPSSVAAISRSTTAAGAVPHKRHPLRPQTSAQSALKPFDEGKP